MPVVYLGSSTGITPNQAVSITNPADGDALTAASNNAGPNALANFLQFLQERALLSNFNNAAGVANANGGWFTGNGAGSGVRAIGGNSSGIGVYAEGGNNNGNGVYAIGKGDGTGVVAEAGTNTTGTVAVSGVATANNSLGGSFSSAGTNGVGLRAASTSHRGIEGRTSGATGVGVHGTTLNVAGTAAGIEGDGGGGASTVGGRFRNGASGRANRAIEVATGHIRLASGNAANTEAFTNSLVANNIVKAYGRIRWSNGAPFLEAADCFNVSSISSSTGNILITLAQALAGYAIIVGNAGSTIVPDIVMRVPVNDGASPYRIFVQQAGGASVDFNITNGEIRFIIIGIQ